MTQTQHTSGPWTALEILDGIAIKDSRNVTIAYCDYATDADETEISEWETEANARLIAAAPDLFAALQSIVEMIDPYSLDKQGREARAKAERAIWKATPQRATDRPGDEAAVMHEETGIDYERCLIMCNMD